MDHHQKETNILRIFFISDHKINDTMSASYTEYAKNTEFSREKKIWRKEDAVLFS